VHRKRSIHSNVDSLSRPVIELMLVNKAIKENESTKTLDIYEDDALLYRLKMG
jgi:hypothetical protein